MPDRRKFLHAASLISAGMLSGMLQPAWSRNLQKTLRRAEGVAPGLLASDEDFWMSIHNAFTAPQDIINLNNGGVSPAPRVVAESMKTNYDFINAAPSFYMWRVLDRGREPLRKALAMVAGCGPDEIAINRNATEGLSTIIFGLSLQAGDEVVLCRQDYNHVIFCWEQRAARDGIRINWVDLDLPSTDEDYMVQQYIDAFTPRTRAVNITHVVNWNGQILPVAAIAREARKRGIEVIVDGAHSFNHFDFKIPELGADYFATSLHKWTYAPVGTGMLYVKKEKIARLWPMVGAEKPTSPDIRKFEQLGTRPFYIEQATNVALDFNNMIGIARKQERLHYLKNYWMDRVKGLPGVCLKTSTDPRWACAIGMVSVDGRMPVDLHSFLEVRHRVHTTTINWAGISGVRITPNVYTMPAQLDVLIDGIKAYVKQ